MSDSGISVDELTDAQIEAVLNSRGFQKMLAYSRLADGIEVLEDEDEIFDSMVGTITAKHSNITTEASVREVLELFREEVETFTEPLVDADDETSVDPETMEDVFVDDGGER